MNNFRTSTYAHHITPVSRVLLWLNIGIFILHFLVARIMGNDIFTPLFGLSYQGLIHGWIWQVFTYSLLHAGPWHLFANMLGLYFFGPEIEQSLGSRRFLAAYMVCGVIAGLGWLAISAAANGVCIGASGAVYGIMGIFAGLYPLRRIQLLVFFILPVTMTARTLIFVSGLLALMFMMTDTGSIAHAAHLAGGLAGYLYGVGLRRAGNGLRGLGLSHWFRQHLQRRPRLEIIMPDEVLPPTPSQSEVNRILEKISREGFGTLTQTELKTLELASKGSNRR